LDEWVTVVTSAFIDIEDQCELGGHDFRLLLISRRSCERQGTRFNVRGADDKGNVANYVESEQIAVFPGGHITSYVQVRGSIPILWQQPATLKYTPKVEFTGDDGAHLAAANKHFQQQLSFYGEMVCVNLIDKKGDQEALGTLYGQVVDKIRNSHLRYIWFDFHHECRNMKWHNLSKLVDQVGEDFSKQGYFSMDETGKVHSVQKGVIRTNCVDNLDRTNVVQSLFARKSLLAQFQKSSQSVLDSPYPRFEGVFKNMWADHADAISLLYSGTGALKTDFTRTGKRTKAGLISDGINSVTRYYLNNFADGRTQDSVDLFLGRFEPDFSRGQETRYKSPFSERRPCSPATPYFLIRLLLIIFTFIITLLTKCSLKKFDGRKFVDQTAFFNYAKPAIPHPLLVKKSKSKSKH